MKELQVMKRELEDIITNRRYMAGFFLQLLLLVLIVPAFGSFLAEGEIRAVPVSMKGFVPIGLVGAGGGASIITEKLLLNDRLEVAEFDRYPAEALERGELSAVLVIPEGYDEGSARRLEVLLFIDESGLKEGVAYDAVFKSVRSASAEIGEERKRRFGVQMEEPLTLHKELLRPVVVEKRGERFSSFFLGYLLPVVLLFPVFMSGSLVVDSIVGEKERGTLEGLLASPAGSGGVVVGKFLGVFSFITFQCILWLALLGGTGTPVGGLLPVLFILALLNGAVIGLAVFLAVYSRDSKEANLLLMILYVFVFVAMLTSLTLDFFNPGPLSLASPFVLVSRLLLGGGPGAIALLLAGAFLASCSVLSILGSVKLLERDDIVFGPRAQTFEIFSDLVEGILLRFKGSAAALASIALASGMLAVFLSALLEVFTGIATIFFFGYSGASVAAMIVLFALAEEGTKPLALLSIASRDPRRISGLKRGMAYGALCGLGFFLMENLFVLSFLFFAFPKLVLRILSLRIGATLAVHAGCSGIVGIGVARHAQGRKGLFLYLLLSALLHAAYNLSVLGAVL